MMTNQDQQAVSQSSSSATANENHPEPLAYGKRNWKKWILIYVVIAAIIYAGIYYLVLSKQGTKSYQTKYSTPTTLPTIAPQPTTTQEQTVDTSNWKTYTNDKYGFSFQYPSTYQLKENTKVDPYAVIVVEDISKIGTISNVARGPFMHITIILNESSISDFINDPQNDLLLTGEEDLGPNSFTIARKKIGQEPGAPSKYYLIKHGDRIIEILNSPGYPLDKSIFNQILSTFTFE